jgi:hypothetical protein
VFSSSLIPSLETIQQQRLTQYFHNGEMIISIQCAQCQSYLPLNILEHQEKEYSCSCKTGDLPDVHCDTCFSIKNILVYTYPNSLFICIGCKKQINIPSCPCGEGFLIPRNRDNRIMFYCEYCESEQD